MPPTKPTAARKPRPTPKADLPIPTLPTSTPPAPARGRRSFRAPSAKPSWPVLAVVGPDKAGKSFECARASASNLIDRTFWVGFGEKDPNEYGALHGARFELVDHDGTPRDVRAAIEDAAAEPRGEKPHLLVIDSGSRYYDAVRASAELTASQNGRDTLSSELWSKVNTEWFLLLAVARRWAGPVLITARTTTAHTTENGRLTSDTVDRVQGHHAFAFDVDGTVELIEPGRAYLSGIRSLTLPSTRGEFPDFSVDALWRGLGLADLPVGTPTYAEPVITPLDAA